MKIIIGEDAWTWLSRVSYRGTIGIFYESTIGGILSYIIAMIFAILAFIGLITVMKWLIKRNKKKK